MRLSLLDRTRTRTGEPDSAALHHTVERARRAERLGYHRFWVAEHHGVPGIASGSPPVLMAAVAAATGRIRVGSGGIMLPNHQPLVVAEQAGDRGLPVVVGGPVLDDPAALEGYRRRAGDRAHVVVSADVLVGRPELALPEAWALAVARTTGEFPPLEPPDPDRSMTDRQRRDVERALRRTITGDDDHVAGRLESLLRRTGADELLVTSSTFDTDALAESDARLAAVLSGLAGRVPA